MNRRSFLIKRCWGCLAVLFLLGNGASIQAECTYFRTKARMEKCKPVQLKVRPADMPAPSDELGEPIEVDHGLRVQVLCLCEYSLAGADPRCDFDRTEEATAYLMAPDQDLACAMNRNACDDLCAAKIP